MGARLFQHELRLLDVLVVVAIWELDMCLAGCK